MALVNEIIASHSKRDDVAEGDLAIVRVDKVYVQDGNSPTIARLFEQHRFSGVFDPDAVGIFFDHSVIAPDKAIANRLKEARAFADRIGVTVFPQGAGISHVVALEENWYRPGTIVVGSDSHTCTGGVTQCLALGMGASDVTAAMVTGECWLKVPETVWLRITGTPGPKTRAKDVVLHVLSQIGQEPFLYKSIEWTGEWTESLALDSAATVASLGVELGAKCVFLPDGPGRPAGMKPIVVNEDAKVFDMDISGLPPMIAKPHSPSNVVPMTDLSGLPVDYVFVGSCTNSRLRDIGEVAGVFKGRKVPAHVHCLVTPGSRQIFLDALERGYVETITRAGGIVTPPGCGSCLGTQGSIPADGDRVVSTMNRNFLGRMGNPNSENYLASPLVAAHTAILGRIPDLEDLG